jgi:hypothetical protein
MRALRVFALLTLLVVGSAGTSFAQYSNAIGTFPAKIGVVPGALPDAGASLPPELQNVGPDLYVGKLTVARGLGGVFLVTYKGKRADGAGLTIFAKFSPDWAGIKFGSLVVGPSLQTGVITGDDIAHLLKAFVDGCGTVDGRTKRVIANVGAGGVVENFHIVSCENENDQGENGNHDGDHQ